MTFNPYEEWEEYQAIEEDFLRYLRNVPLSPTHYSVWSFPLSNLLINIGSLIDSFFKNIANEQSMKNAPGVNTIIGASGQANITRYQNVFETFYSLSKSPVTELRNYSVIFPFTNWGKGNQKTTSPVWWKAYTGLKHDRFKNKENATLENTLNALAALFLLNVKSVETIQVLIDLEIVKGFQYSTNGLRQILSQKEPVDDTPLMPIIAKTSLFGYVYESSNIPYSDKDKKRMLSPSYQGFG